jgi:hypothetical protein
VVASLLRHLEGRVCRHLDGRHVVAPGLRALRDLLLLVLLSVLRARLLLGFLVRFQFVGAAFWQQHHLTLGNALATSRLHASYDKDGIAVVVVDQGRSVSNASLVKRSQSGPTHLFEAILGPTK